MSKAVKKVKAIEFCNDRRLLGDDSIACLSLNDCAIMRVSQA